MKLSHRAFLVAVILSAPHMSPWVAILAALFFIVVALVLGDSE